MKNVFIIVAVVLFSSTAFSQTLITLGTSSTATSKDEFLRAYNKNKPATDNREKSMREYLQLYTNFKLKVKAAEEMRLDTLTQIKYDVQNFREQVTDNYLNNDDGIQTLVNEAANRSRKDIHVVYFSVPVAQNATPADTLKAYNTAKEISIKLKKDSVKYADVIKEINSAGLSDAKYSNIGFITAFSTPYNFENIIYNTKSGAVSEPYRSISGWNIFKVIEERPNTGKWKVAHLLFAFPPDADSNTKLAIKLHSDSVYKLLQNGLSFAEAATKYSDDRITYLAGGLLPEFTTGKYSYEFEKNVFSLETDSSITKPFETQYGYHIVKRIGITPLPENKNDAAYLFDIKQKVQQDSRIDKEKAKFIQQITQKTGFKKLSIVTEKELFRYADSILINPTVENTTALAISNKNIVSFKNGTQIKGQEWLKFVTNYRSTAMAKMENAKTLWSKFEAQIILNYYKKHLEEYNNDFKYQMKEFAEGNMLFEIMERNVWSKAAADSIGLLKYYNANKGKYRWMESADVLILNCTDEKKAVETMDSLKNGKSWLLLAENSNGSVQADSGRYELAQLPNYNGMQKPKVGSFSSIIKNTDGTAAFVKYIKLYDANMQRNFTEARGLVINDYQNVLEEQWIESLRKKYPVKINEATLKAILK